jgi:hypothetical protein
MAGKYSKGAQRKVKKVMKERKSGTLRSGRSGEKVRAASKPLRLVSPRRAGPVRKCRRRRIVVPGVVRVELKRGN